MAETERQSEPDVGFTHVALTVQDLDASIAFYGRFADLRVVHERSEGAQRVAWMSDLRRDFVIVLLETATVEGGLRGVAHLGIGCATREEVERRCALARREGRPTTGPKDAGPPVGYWAFIEDPDGHNLELSHGQEVGLTVRGARLPSRDA